jgi:antitoxin (DNA-binding transcriptional repressor) of toxin-antitoxin stability system
MKTVDIGAPDYDLPALVEEAIAGEEIVLERNGKPVARLTPVDDETHHNIRSTLGLWKGKVWMSDDFDAPLPDDILRGFGAVDRSARLKPS